MSEIHEQRTELWEVERLIPYAKNAKKHPQEHLEKLGRSIGRLGLANPPHIEPDGTIIAGHGRWLTVKDILGWKKIPVIVRYDLSKLEADALRLSDNDTVWNEFDEPQRAEEIQRLAGIDPDLMAQLNTVAELERTNSDVLSQMDDSVMADDITVAVEEQKAENKTKEAEIDATAAPIADAFGFKRTSVENSRVIRDFMSKIEIVTGQTGADALVTWIKQQPLA